MKIIKNEDFLISSGQSNPIYYVIDDYDNIVFNGTTEEECIAYIEENKDKI
jgi:hypothetical protein